jgi:hypothetical protein
MVNLAKMSPLVPLTQAHKGELHVRGYAGNDQPDHMMHLAQMSETAIPDLVRYWSEPAAP